MGVVHDGLAAHPNRGDLLRLSKDVELQFIAHKTPDTAAAVDEMGEAKAKARQQMKQAEADITIAVRDQKWARRLLNEAKSAFAPVAPVCAQYERINCFNRKCKHCQRKKADCEASRPAKERLDKAQAKYKKVSLSAEHFVYLLVILFGDSSRSWYYLVMLCKSGCRCANKDEE